MGDLAKQRNIKNAILFVAVATFLGQLYYIQTLPLIMTQRDNKYDCSGRA